MSVGQIATPGVPYKVELRGVSKAFRVDGRVVSALADVSLTARAGEFVTLIGPSGCGKSTLFNIICGLLEPDRGEVWLDGELTRRRAGCVAYMPQRDLLLPWRSVLDNAILGPEIAGQSRELARAEARELLPLFGLAGFDNAYPATLSGGMRQRAALLRTFLCHHDVMLLDEPFGALDALTRAELQGWLLGVWARFRHTILFITHDVDEAVFLSDRVYVMTPRPGRIQAVVNVPLPRPRARELVVGRPFVETREALLRLLTA
ncbi:MAG: ABC transporter ATP-binding protein [Chloroflexi bacterium]|nr:ABC transporter ATP-binding protein [Chloroflexota bacterium]MBU1749070.1 ABC transporter ATP-binding protein [Chloroflexota bacterium]